MKKTLEEILAGVTSGIKTGIKHSNEEYKKKIRENISNSITYSQMDMVNDLYYVFNNGNYAVIRKIGSFQNIRPAGWVVRGNDVLFRYCLSKETTARVPSVVLDSIRDNMNTDLRMVAQILFNNMGFEANLLYPYLMAGIKVNNVVDLEADIVITCTVNRAFGSY